VLETRGCGVGAGACVGAGAGVDGIGGVGAVVGAGAGAGGATGGAGVGVGAGVGTGAGAGCGGGAGTGEGAAVSGGSSAGAFNSVGSGGAGVRSIGARSMRLTVVGVSLRMGAGRSGNCRVGEGACSASVGTAGRVGVATLAGAMRVGAVNVDSPGVVSVVIVAAGSVGVGAGAGEGEGEGDGAGTGGGGAGDGAGVGAGTGVGAGGGGAGVATGAGAGAVAAGIALRSAGASPVSSSPGCCRHCPWRAAPGVFCSSGVGGRSRTAPPERGCFASPTGPRSGTTTAGSPEPGS